MMLNRLAFAHLFIAIVMAVRPAFADITVTRLSGPTSFTVNELTEPAGKWKVRITAEVGATPLVLAVEADDSSDIIEYLRVEVDDPGTPDGARVELHIRAKSGTSGRLVRVEEVKFLEDPTIANGELWLNQLETDLTAGGLDGNIGGQGTSKGGLIRVHQIDLLHAAGNITADIVVPLFSGSTALDAEVIRADGSLFGDVIVEFGRIGTIEIEGDIGSPSVTPGITAAGNESTEVGIGNVEADSIKATIASGPVPNFDGFVRRIECRSGDITGALAFLNFSDEVAGTGDPGLFVADDFTGAIFVLRDLTEGVIDIDGDLTAGSAIIVSESMTGTSADARITLGAGGLKGQVIVNFADEDGEWTGGVRVGSTNLSPAPYYSQTGLGGGAVGLAPFHLHGEDCVPAACASVSSVPNDEIVLRFFGPAIWDDELMPVTVDVSIPFSETCPPSGLTWFEVTDDFTVEDPNPAAPREVVVKPLSMSGHFISGAIYRIRPAIMNGEFILRCDDLLADLPVADFTYYVRIPAP